jgi:inner membrane protein involved in colicin E2 resistance
MNLPRRGTVYALQKCALRISKERRTMTKRILALVTIFAATSVAWFILGGVTKSRTYSQDSTLRNAVGRLWGQPQKQQAPRLYYETREVSSYETSRDGEKVLRSETKTVAHPVDLDGSDVAIGLSLRHRRKGLLWYSTYGVDFAGKYRITNPTSETRDIFFVYTFPTAEGTYGDFRLAVDGKDAGGIRPQDNSVTKAVRVDPGRTRTVEVSYESQGMDEWWYLFGGGIAQVKDFSLVMTTDFDDIDFPDNSISPTEKEKTKDGWKLAWRYGTLISGIQIGMTMPRKLNPGPLAARVSFFAPVSLFLFMFLLFIITTVKRIRIHPMNYFFIAAAFFSFHLLLAYLVDHVHVHVAFAVCSVVSIGLVVSYMRLVAGMRFALLAAGLSQFVYLVLFSYAFFLEGYTGLSITVLTIVTLFVVMQATGRIDWAELSTRES